MLNYIKSDKFKNNVKDNIDRAKELGEILKKEMSSHDTVWKKRFKHYQHILNNSSHIDRETAQIIKEEIESEDLLDEEREIELLIPRKKKKKNRE